MAPTIATASTDDNTTRHSSKRAIFFSRLDKKDQALENTEPDIRTSIFDTYTTSGFNSQEKHGLIRKFASAHQKTYLFAKPLKDPFMLITQHPYWMQPYNPVVMFLIPLLFFLAISAREFIKKGKISKKIIFFIYGLVIIYLYLVITKEEDLKKIILLNRGYQFLFLALLIILLFRKFKLFLCALPVFILTVLLLNGGIAQHATKSINPLYWKPERNTTTALFENLGYVVDKTGGVNLTVRTTAYPWPIRVNVYMQATKHMDTKTGDFIYGSNQQDVFVKSLLVWPYVKNKFKIEIQNTKCGHARENGIVQKYKFLSNDVLSREMPRRIHSDIIDIFFPFYKMIGMDEYQPKKDNDILILHCDPQDGTYRWLVTEDSIFGYKENIFKNTIGPNKSDEFFFKNE